MPFELSSFLRLRPYLFHLTDARNLPGIFKDMNLRSAASIASVGGAGSTLDSKRKTSFQVMVDGNAMSIRDQKPLHERNMLLAPGWTFDDVLQDLNRRVFFWPGKEIGPIKYGKNHFERYAEELPVVLRVRTEDLFSLNSQRTPEFCKYNSGSPRFSGGRGSPRGPDTFQVHHKFEWSRSEVVEVTFVDQVDLPEFEVGVLRDGKWAPRD